MSPQQKQLTQPLMIRLQEFLVTATEVAKQRIQYKTRVAISGSLTSIFLFFSPIGSYLDRVLYLDPMARAQAALGLTPLVSPEFRFVVLDDRSLKTLGHVPTYAEWYQVAAKLFGLGYERVVLLGLPENADDVPTSTMRRERGKFIASSALTEVGENARAEPVALMDARLFTEITRGSNISIAELPSPPPRPLLAVTPSQSALRLADHIGMSNLEDATSMIGGIAPYRGAMIPNIALLSAGNLTWESDGPFVDERRVPLSFDGTLTLDYVDIASLSRARVALAPFYERDGKTLKENLSKALLDRLQGGKIAFLVPDGYTGSRFVETPVGKHLSYFAITSLASRIRDGKVVKRPLSPFALSLIWLPLATFGFIFIPRRMLLKFVPLFIASLAIGHALLEHFAGIRMLCVPACGLIFGMYMVPLGEHLAKIVAERFRLLHSLELGRAIQRHLVAGECEGTFGRWRYRVFFRPHGPMSGDWVQTFFDEERGRAVLAMGDVVGKGPSAALITAVISTLWREYEARWGNGDFDVESWLHSMDRTIFRTFGGEQNTTLSIVVIDGANVKLGAWGCPPWISYDPTTRALATLRGKPQDPLGSIAARKGRTLALFDASIASNSVLMAVTDGILESRQIGGDFRRDVLNCVEFESDIFEHLYNTAIKTGGDTVLEDDRTALFLQPTPRQREPP